MARKEETLYHGLDQVLNSTEFETSQQEQAIQNEVDKIQAFEREIEEKEREIADFERIRDDVESRREKTQRQLQLNRDNIESLKHTVTVLDEHLEAINKSYQSAVQKTQNISAEYNSAVARYTDKWERFQTTYQRMPKAQELSNKMEELNQIKAEEMALDCEILETQKTIDAMKSEDWDTTVKWVLQIATVRVETNAILHLLSSTRQAVYERKVQLGLKPLSTKTAEEEDKMSVDTPEQEMDRAEEDTPTTVPASPTPMDVAFNKETSTENSEKLSNCLLSPPENSDALTSQQPEGSNSPPGPALSGAVEMEASHIEGTSKESVGQGESSGVFVRPQAPPRRFTVTKPTSNMTTAVQSPANVPIATTSQQPANTHTSVMTSAVSGRVSLIPPAYQIQSPKPPVPLSPKPPASPGIGKPKFTFELPKFSLPPPSYAASSIQPLDQWKSSRVQSGGSVQASDSHKQQTNASMRITPSVSAPSYQKSSSVTESMASVLQLKMPPKPVLPPLSQTPARVASSVSQLPSFTLPSLHPPQAAHTTNSSHTQQKRHQSHCRNSIPQETSPPNIHSSREQGTIRDHTSKVVLPLAKASSTTATTPRDQQQQKQYKNQGQTVFHEVEYISHQQPRTKQLFENQEGMEVGGDRTTGEDSDRGEFSSFDPAHTSIDFGEQSVDFDSSTGPLFGLPADDSFSVSQTGSLFNTNQVQSAGTYNFMEMSMNEEESSSTTNLQDFFSQFGKTTSSSTEAGTFLF